MVPLTGVVLAYLRNTVDTQARLTESHDVQFAAAYWQRDVASIGVRSSDLRQLASHSFPLLQSVDLCRRCAVPRRRERGRHAGVERVRVADSTDPPRRSRSPTPRGPAGGVYELLRVRCGSQPSTTSSSPTTWPRTAP